MTAHALDYSTLMLATQDPQGFAAYRRAERRQARRDALSALADQARALLGLTPRH